MNANMRQDLTCLSHTLQEIETYYYKEIERERVISQFSGEQIHAQSLIHHIAD